MDRGISGIIGLTGFFGRMKNRGILTGLQDLQDFEWEDKKNEGDEK